MNVQPDYANDTLSIYGRVVGNGVATVQFRSAWAARLARGQPAILAEENPTTSTDAIFLADAVLPPD